MLKRFASNASANVLTGAVTASYQLALAGLASRSWQGSDFASWALALSVASICQLFSANLSSVVTRRIVTARHSGSTAPEGAIVVAATRQSTQLAGLAVITLMIGGLLTHMASRASNAPLPMFCTLLLLLLGSQVWIVVLQARFGLQFADENNWAPALTMAAARLGGLGGFAACLWAGDANLLLAAVGLFIGTWATLGLASAVIRRPTDAHIEATADDVHREYRTNLKLLSGFAIWAIASLLIQYGIPPLVAIIEPTQFNAFYLASTLNLIALGTIAAAMSALLAPMSRWHAAGDSEPMRRMVLWGPLLCSMCSLLVLALAWNLLGPMLSLLSSKAASVNDIHTFLALLGLQTIVRTAAMGYSVGLASAGTPRQMVTPILLEITLTLAAASLVIWRLDTRALLLGLILAGWVSTLCTCQIGAKLAGNGGVSRFRAMTTFVSSQAGVSLLWCWIVRDAL
jgi:hypothetical protein